MAIIESIILDQASGSIDGITYYMLNGQLVARSRNRTPYDPKTPAQMAQRNKLANSTFGYIYMKNWISNITPMVITPRTLFNTYTSLFTPLFSNERASNMNQLLTPLASANIGSSNYCTISSFDLVGLRV